MSSIKPCLWEKIVTNIHDKEIRIMFKRLYLEIIKKEEMILTQIKGIKAV